MAVIKTKIVTTLPEAAQVEANTQYLLKNGDKFDLFVADNNKSLRQLQVDTNDNLLRQSATFMNLRPSSGFAGYNIIRLWNATPVIYGLRNTASGQEVWGVQSRGLVLNNELFLKDLRNKPITVSVDVMPRNYKTAIGLGVVESDVQYVDVEPNEWKRISIHYTGTEMPTIWAKLADGVTVTGIIAALTNAVYFKNWKVEEGGVATAWIPASTDYMDSASHYVKTYQLPTTGAFRTDTLVEGQFQNGKTIGLANANTTVTISYSVYTFKVRYLFLLDNSTLTLTGTSATISNSDQPQQNVFKGNRGDYVDVEFFQDQNNAMQVMAWQTKIKSTDFMYKKTLLATEDLNNIREFGLYLLPQKNVVDLNYPDTILAGNMQVMPISGFLDNSAMYQIVNGYKLKNGVAESFTYKRTFINNTFGTWVKIDTQNSNSAEFRHLLNGTVNLNTINKVGVYIQTSTENIWNKQEELNYPKGARSGTLQVIPMSDNFDNSVGFYQVYFSYGAADIITHRNIYKPFIAIRGFVNGQFREWTYMQNDIYTLKAMNSFKTSDFLEGYSQNGKKVICTNTTAITVTIDSEDYFTVTYLKSTAQNVTFVAGEGKTLSAVGNITTLSGGKGSTAEITMVGNEAILRISNV